MQFLCFLQLHNKPLLCKTVLSFYSLSTTNHSSCPHSQQPSHNKLTRTRCRIWDAYPKSVFISFPYFTLLCLIAWLQFNLDTHLLIHPLPFPQALPLPGRSATIPPPPARTPTRRSKSSSNSSRPVHPPHNVPS